MRWQNLVSGGTALAALVLVSGCGTTLAQDQMAEAGSNIQMSRADTQSCENTLALSPQLIDIRPHLAMVAGEPSLGQRLDPDMPTTLQVQEMVAWHAGLNECRTQMYSTVQASFPFLYEPLHHRADADDTIYTHLAQQQISWGQANLAIVQEREVSDAETGAALAEWMRHKSHESRMERINRADAWRLIDATVIGGVLGLAVEDYIQNSN